MQAQTGKAWKWEEAGGVPVLTPLSSSSGEPLPITALIHFIGGVVVGHKPREAYGEFLQQIMAATEETGIAIIATPLPSAAPAFDHSALAEQVLDEYSAARESLAARFAKGWTPEVGVGHSLGAKLHVLLGSTSQSEDSTVPMAVRAGGNVLMSYNNFSAKDSVPPGMRDRAEEVRSAATSVSPFLRKVAKNLRNINQDFNLNVKESDIASLEGLGDKVSSFVDEASSAIDRDFTPTPEEVEALIRDKYAVPDNFIIQFSNDSIDQSEKLQQMLTARFPPKAGASGNRSTILYRLLEGTHVTPMTPSFGSGLDDAEDPLRRSARQTAAQSRQQLDALVVVVSAYLRVQLERLEKMASGRALLSP